MFSISKNVEYALMCLKMMSDSTDVWSSRDLAERLNIPLKLLEKILQKLSSKDLINSMKGPTGGYSLKREPHTIMLNEIIEAVYGPLHLTHCMEKRYKCIRKGTCIVRPGFHNLQGMITSFLISTSLQDFVKLEVPK